MQETGLRNGAFGADKFGLKNLKTVHWNLGAPQLYQYSLAAGEAVLSADGALCADTGEFTGRSPEGQVHGSRRDHRQEHVVGRQPVDHLGPVRRALCRLPQACRRHDAVRAGSLWRRRSDLPDQDPRLHRTRLALAVHPHAADPPRGVGAAGISCPNSPSSTCRASAPIPNVTAANPRTSSRSISPARSS